MESNQSKVVVLLRIAGNVLACVRDGELVRTRKIGVFTVKPPDQTQVLKLLRPKEAR